MTTDPTGADPRMASAISSDRQSVPIPPAVAELMAIMKRARRRWSRDDYADETQDEAVALAILDAGYARHPADATTNEKE